MAKLVQKKIAGSSLIEVLIAMVIIMVIFAIAMRVFANVMSTGVSLKKIKVQNQLQLLSKKVQQVGYFISQHEQIDSIDYFLFADTSSTPGLSKLLIKASKDNQLLGEVKCLFKPKEFKSED